VYTPVLDGSVSLRLRDSNIIGGSGSADSPIITVEDVGEARTFSINVYPTTSGSEWKCRFRHYPNGIGFSSLIIATVGADTLNPNAWNELSYTITPAGADDLIIVQLLNVGGFGSKDWYFDQLRYGDLMAIKLAERGVDAIVSLLQANLGAEIGLINTDRGDGVNLSAPANSNYYKHDRSEITGGTVWIEVYEGSLTFPTAEEDAAASRATYDLPFTVRVTFFRRTGSHDSADMVTLARRYATAIFNVINKNFDLADSDDATKGAWIDSVDRVIEDDDQGPYKCRVTLTGLMKCEELH
jgi:hypothetical protein